MPGKHSRQSDKSIGDTCFIQKVSGKYKQRNRKKGKALRLRDGQLYRHGKGQLWVLDKEDSSCDAYRKGYGHSHHQKNDKQDKYQQHLPILLTSEKEVYSRKVLFSKSLTATL
jgi:hypothetical protein